MLPSLHNRAYQDFLTLLTKFDRWIRETPPEEVKASIKDKFKYLTDWFNSHITELSQEDIAGEIAPRWQAVQTEIKREFKLLATDILFLATARQNKTQINRRQIIVNRLTKLIGYCQVMLKNSE